MTTTPLTRPATMPDGLRSFAADRRLTGPLALSHDGTRLAVVLAEAGRQALLLAEPATGRERRVDLGARVISAIQFANADSVYCLITDEEGPAVQHLDWAGSMTRTPVPVAGEWFVRGTPLAPSGRLLAYGFHDQQAGRLGLRLHRLDTMELVAEVLSHQLLVPMSWSPDELRLACLAGTSEQLPRVAVLDLASGAVELGYWTESTGDRWLPAGWLDRDTMLTITDAGSDVLRPAPLAAPGSRWQPADRAADSGWECESLARAGDTSWVCFNEHGFSRLQRRIDGEVPEWIEVPPGVISKLTCSGDGRTAAFRMQAADAPARIYLVGPDQPHGRPAVSCEFVDPDVLTTPARLVRFAAPENRTISAISFVPAAPARAVVISIHNGPEAQERPRLAHSGVYQYLAANQVTVIAPNIGGSTGFGRSEGDRVTGDWGGRDLADLLAVIDQVAAEQPGLPIGLYGVSYGGFLALHALAHRPWLATAATVAAPCNLGNFVDNVPAMFAKRICSPDLRRSARARYLWSRSPLTVADRITAPLLLVQGDADPWVPVADTEALAATVRAGGAAVSVRVVPGAGHHLGRHGRAELQAIADHLLKVLVPARADHSET